MNKRIFRYMVFLIIFTVLFFALLWGTVFSVQLGPQIKNELKTLRVSLIDESGNVVFDNMANPSDLENHSNRKEIEDAIKYGEGESERLSGTLGEKTYYYAVQLESGNILRLALTTNRIEGLIYKFVLVVFICLFLSGSVASVIARRLTKKMIAPINNIDLDRPELGDYDELSPLIKKIESQKEEISKQLLEIESRTATTLVITENMKEGLLLLDKNGTVLMANESVLGILNKSEVIWKNVVEVYRESNFLKQMKECLAGKKTESVLHVNKHTYSVLYNPVFEDDIIKGAIVLFIDITGRYAVESQRKEFSANVSHELKTPLTTIAALSEMIMDGTVREEDIKTFANKIYLQSKRVISIIEDIIRLSEFDEGNVVKDFIDFNLYELADSVIMNLSEKLSEKNVEIELNGDPNLRMTGNMHMVDELLYNLLDNSIKYNRDPGKIIINLSEQNEYVKIDVSDTGIGISKEHIGRIFERFYRVDKSRSKKTGGNGLGLSIVKHVVGFHDGYIKVESEIGEGTTFSCFLKKNISK